jgi:hypothetical protein
MSQVAVAALRRHVVKPRRCALPTHRDEAASRRLSEPAKREYQKVRLSATAGEEAPPGLIKRPSTIKQMMMKIPTSVAGSAMLELEASVAVASGEEAGCELLAPDPDPGAVLGNAAFPELGTSGVTLAGTVVLGATAFSVPAVVAGAVSTADCDVEL